MTKKTYATPSVSKAGEIVVSTLGGINVPPFEAPMQHKTTSAL